MSILEVECDEILNEAIMSNTPIILVEGAADIPIYEQLSESNDLKSEVYAVENIDGFAAGCRGVIDCLNEIREHSDGTSIENHILGIIDRDARYYRGEIPLDKALLVLEYYSMESHFITEEATALIVRTVTRVTNTLLEKGTRELIHNKIQKSLLELFTLSLEALKNAVQEDYESLFGYGTNIQQIKNQNLHVEVMEKERELDEFATSINIEKSWDNLLKVCKGKWVFFEYCQLLQKEVASLANRCKESQIKQCQFCFKESFDNCLYKIQSNFNETNIRQLLFSNLHTSNLNYVVDRVSALG